jgi:hypothetical protein
MERTSAADCAETADAEKRDIARVSISVPKDSLSGGVLVYDWPSVGIVTPNRPPL